MYLGNQVRDDTNGAHHEAKHKWVSRLYIVLQTIKIYISAPSNPNNQRLLVWRNMTYVHRNRWLIGV
jgi:hypothetical protein